MTRQQHLCCDRPAVAAQSKAAVCWLVTRQQDVRCVACFPLTLTRMVLFETALSLHESAHACCCCFACVQVKRALASKQSSGVLLDSCKQSLNAMSDNLRVLVIDTGSRANTCGSSVTSFKRLHKGLGVEVSRFQAFSQHHCSCRSVCRAHCHLFCCQ